MELSQLGFKRGRLTVRETRNGARHARETDGEQGMRPNSKARPTDCKIARIAKKLLCTQLPTLHTLELSSRAGHRFVQPSQGCRPRCSRTNIPRHTAPRGLLLERQARQLAIDACKRAQANYSQVESIARHKTTMSYPGVLQGFISP